MAGLLFRPHRRGRPQISRRPASHPPVHPAGPRHHIGGTTNFDLTDEEKLALAAELRRTIAEDRYPLSPRVRTLQSILDKLDPRPAHDPAPPLKRYEPPWKGRYRTRN
jgi:hypothetical protein